MFELWRRSSQKAGSATVLCMCVCAHSGDNREWNGFEMVQVENKTLQWFGASLDASASDDPTAVIVVRSTHKIWNISASGTLDRFSLKLQLHIHFSPNCHTPAVPD